MKWSANILSLGLLAAFASTAAVVGRQLDLYQLQISW